MKHRDKRAALIAKIFHPCIALQPTCKDSHRHDESTHIANTNAFATPSLPAQLLQAVCIHPHPLNSDARPTSHAIVPIRVVIKVGQIIVECALSSSDFIGLHLSGHIIVRNCQRLVVFQCRRSLN